MSSTGSSRGNPAMADIVRSMVVIALIILAVYGIGKFFTRDGGDPVTPVDYAQVVEQARPVADFPLAAPDELPEGWRSNSARFRTDTWHLGMLTDEDEYIGLEQVTSGPRQTIAQFAKGSKAAGTIEIEGRTWDVRTGPNGRTTLVRTDGGVTTLVNGTAPRRVVEDYVASLSES